MGNPGETQRTDQDSAKAEAQQGLDWIGDESGHPVEAARELMSKLDLRDPSGRTRRDVISATNSLEYG